MSALALARVHVLEQAVADRIAAGEVVERPASVVKELVENALDAGATQVTIEVEGAGSTLIRVGDNGLGIHPDDVAVAVRRFATSKIQTSDDLVEVGTLGFRGEALPSIAAVSRLELTSALPGAPAARRIRVVGGTVEAEEDAGGAPGTVVTVRHLFFNTPARRRFLRSPAREFALIVDAVQRLALVQPAVGFRLLHERDEVLRYAPGDAAERAAQVLGGTVCERCLPFAAAADDLTLRGWLGRPELARATRSLQFLIVNGRPVHSRVVGAAVEEAYRQIIPPGKVPVYVLFLALPRRRVDVNVHPRKLEVRFDDERQLFRTLAREVRRALRDAQLIRPMSPGDVSSPGTSLTLGVQSDRVSEGGVASGSSTIAMFEVPAGRLPAIRLLGQLHRTYLLAQSEDGLLVIDQHAAHERVLYERMLRARIAGEQIAQTLFVPLSVELTGREWGVLAEQRDAFEALGFSLEPFGERTVLVRALPAAAAAASAEQLLRELLAESAEGHRLGASRDLLERLTITTACRTAVRAGDVLSGEQMTQLLRDLAATQDPFTCFHGRPTLVAVTREQVERWFLRR